MTPTVWLILVANALAAFAPQAPTVPTPDVAHVQRDAWVMGTRVRIVVEDPDPDRASRTAETILRDIERVDALLTTWEPHGLLARLNDARPGAPARVEPELAGLLHEAVEWRQRTGGAFEPVMGALVDVWDLRGAGRTPTAQQIAEALAATGAGGVVLEGHRLVRAHAAAWIDSGGFGKGAALRSVGHVTAPNPGEPPPRILVDLGGQILVFAPESAPWKVQVAHPSDRRHPVATLALSGGSVATSGTSERGLHVIDPRTGQPVAAWGSVTVAHRDPFVADVLSTALYVMGRRAGLAFAERHGVAALFLTEEAGQLSTAWTSHMTPSLVAASDPSPLNHRSRERQYSEP